MPAIPEEIEAAEHEGAKFVVPRRAAPHRGRQERPGRAPSRRSGRSSASSTRRAAAGRSRPTRSSASSATRSSSPWARRSTPTSAGPRACKVKESGTIEVDRYSLETSRERFYAGGDLITGASNVSNAMGYGKKAARNIDKRLMGAEALPPDLIPEFDYQMEPPETPSERRPPRTRRDARRRAGRSRTPRSRSASRPWRRWRRRPAACAATSAAPRGREIALTEKVKVRIDGEVIAATAGQTILEVARANNKYIPALCYMEGLSTVGACRLCMVEVSGVARLLPACTTPVQEGQAVATTSPQLESLPARSRSSCCSPSATTSAPSASPPGTASCRRWPRTHGVTHVRYPYSCPRLPVDTTHPRYVLDHNRCVAVLALRAGLRRDRGRARLGRRRARHRLAPRLRAAAAVGRGHDAAPAAASACRPARPARWPRRAGASRR